MKITRIHLKDFHQFKDVDINLTYPKGHPKEGEPLEKVCIIGQSGTGKTTLLKVIGGHTFTINSLFKEYKHEDFKKVVVNKKVGNKEVMVNVFVDSKTKTNSYGWFIPKDQGGEDKFDETLALQNEFLAKTKTHFIYFPADLHYEFEASDKSLSDKTVIDFTVDKVGDIWNLVFEEIQKHQEEGLKLETAIGKIGAEDPSKTKLILAAVRKYETWKKKTLNPINKLAEECLDPILKNINLRVKRDFNFEKRGDIGIVKLEDLKGNEVPYHLLSTGTKQILLTALPLFLLKPEETLILCDEPERSLYPNLQKMIIDYYTSLTKDSQFFFSTHSPIIAASFEPWEVVELKFDDKGFVYQEKYYDKKKERHIDNYNIIPSYLTYDLMLSKVFGLNETHSQERSDKITEVLMLRSQLQSFKENGDTTSKTVKEIYKKYKDLASKLFWDFDIQ